MKLIFAKGAFLFPLALFVFGIEHFIYAGAGPAIMYPWVLGSPAWNYVFGAFLVTLSASIGIGKRVSLAAGVLGIILCLYALWHYVPRIAAHLHDPGPWTNFVRVGSALAAACELLAMGGAACVLAGSRRENRPRLPAGEMEGLERFGRLVFAGTLVVFGVQHFLYSAFLATLIPAWIPGHLFWEYVVGAAFIAAAAGIAANTAARWSALLLGTMFVLFVLVLHVPRAIKAGRSQDEWTSTLVAVAMSGGAFVLAEASKRGPRSSSKVTP